MKPKVSVLMPVKDNVKYIKEAIESVLNQSMSELELLIVDDGSRDGSEMVIDRFARQDDRIRLVRHKKSLGLVRSLNEGLELARADLVARMDGDDIAVADRLKMQMSYLEQHPEVAVVGGCYTRIDNEGNELRIKRVATDRGLLKFLSLFYSPVAHPTVMMRKKEVLNLGGYDNKWLHVEDRELWLRVLAKYQVANLNKVLIKYRVHSGSVSRSKKQEQLENKIKLSVQTIKKYIDINEDELANIYKYRVGFDQIDKLFRRYRLMVKVKNEYFGEEAISTESKSKINRFVWLQYPWWLLIGAKLKSNKK